MGILERKEREKEQKRQSIIDAAEKVFFTKGVENATMDDVAAAAEFSKGTLYLYFRNKEDLYHAIVLRGQRLLMSMFEESVKGCKSGINRVMAIGSAYYDFFKTYPDYFKALLHHQIRKTGSNGDNPCEAECVETAIQIMAFLVEVFKSGLEDGTIRADIKPLEAALVLWSQTVGVLQIVSTKGEALRDLYNFNADDLISYHFKLMEYLLKATKR